MTGPWKPCAKRRRLGFRVIINATLFDNAEPKRIC